MEIEFFTVSLSLDEDGTKVIMTEVNTDFKPFVKNADDMSKKIALCVRDIIENNLEIKAGEINGN